MSRTQAHLLAAGCRASGASATWRRRRCWSTSTHSARVALRCLIAVALVAPMTLAEGCAGPAPGWSGRRPAGQRLVRGGDGASAGGVHGHIRDERELPGEHRHGHDADRCRCAARAAGGMRRAGRLHDRGRRVPALGRRARRDRQGRRDGILSAACYALWMVELGRHLRAFGRPVATAATQFALTAALLLPVGVLHGLSPAAAWAAGPELLVVGVFSTALAFGIQTVAQRFTSGEPRRGRGQRRERVRRDRRRGGARRAGDAGRRPPAASWCLRRSRSSRSAGSRPIRAAGGPDGGIAMALPFALAGAVLGLALLGTGAGRSADAVADAEHRDGHRRLGFGRRGRLRAPRWRRSRRRSARRASSRRSAAGPRAASEWRCSSGTTIGSTFCPGR